MVGGVVSVFVVGWLIWYNCEFFIVLYVMLFNFLIFLMWVWIVLILFVVGVFYLLDMVMGGVYCNFVVVVIFIFVVLIDWFDGFFVCKWN